ncbi:hypothetical protein AAE478_004460 [Parahypoxylon ruwenzoriense]
MGIGLEIPVFGASAASTAIQLGASRIELNAAGSYPDGGLTPSLEDLEHVAHIDTSVPVRIMIRPRGPLPGSGKRDFVYSDEEFDEMEASIRKFRESGLLREEHGDGFVFGILDEGSQSGNVDATRARCRVDRERCRALVDLARPFRTVFHRAFDEIVSCDDDISNLNERQAWKTGLDDLLACGFDVVLTSGGLGRAIQNVGMLDEIITKAEKLGIEIIVGGGVRKHNVNELAQRLDLKGRTYSTHVHSACLSNSDSEHVDSGEVAGILSRLG